MLDARRLLARIWASFHSLAVGLPLFSLSRSLSFIFWVSFVFIHCAIKVVNCKRFVGHCCQPAQLASFSRTFAATATCSPSGRPLVRLSFVSNKAKIYSLDWTVSKMAPKFKARISNCSWQELGQQQQQQQPLNGWTMLQIRLASQLFVYGAWVIRLRLKLTVRLRLRRSRCLQFYCKLFSTETYFFLFVILLVLLRSCKMQSMPSNVARRLQPTGIWL